MSSIYSEWSRIPSFGLDDEANVSLFEGFHQYIASASIVLISVVTVVVASLWTLRRYTKYRLESFGYPTVLWKPKFVTYRADERGQKLASSTITNVLPRMQRLKGPFDMYGTVYGLSTSVIHIADPTPAWAVLTAADEHATGWARFYGVYKAPAYNHFKNFCGEGVFSADGADWKAKRTAVLHVLVRQVEGGYERRTEELANEAATYLIDHMELSATINIVPRLQRATIGLIYRYLTHQSIDQDFAGLHGHDVNGDEVSLQSSDDSSYGKEDCMRENKSLLSRYQDSITQIRMIILAQSRSVWFLLPRWVYRFFSSLYQEEERCMQSIRALASLACHSALPGSPLATLRDEYEQYRSPSPSRVSKNLLDEAITLLFAGQDTSAATLSWTLHLLSLHPDIQTKVAREVRHEAAHDNYISRRETQRMPLLDAVIREAMRLYPVAPFVVRKVETPIRLSGGTEQAVLPPDALACIWIYGLHRNPKYWNRPNDFFPERWQDPSADYSKVFMPFAAGPRNCLGQPLAHIVLRVILSRLLLAFEFSDERFQPGVDAKSLQKDMQAGFTVLPLDGVYLNVSHRTF